MMLLKDLMSEPSHWLLDRNTGLPGELVPVLKIAKSRLLTLLGVQPVFEDENIWGLFLAC